MSNLVFICLCVVLVMQFIMFLYGRYQYLRGLIKGRDDGDHYGITKDDYENYGTAEYNKGYNLGFIEGLNKAESLSESWSCGWIEEAEGWREIIKKILCKSTGVNNEQSSPQDD